MLSALFKRMKSWGVIGYLLAVTMLWFATFYQGIITAIKVWQVSEIFNHCFLVIPGAFYLIYQKWPKVAQHPLKPNFWLLLPYSLILMLQLFGAVGDIKVFMHIATFSALPLLIWMVIGNAAAKEIRFPLYFMLFSIPIGDQLIPHLQQLTTNLAIPLLNFTGVPVFRHGLYIDIPVGQFLVAEACSGISFLVASFVFGNLYAYLSFARFYKQVLFVLVSVIVPIIANAIRVYGIVLTGHLSNMEYAVGVDHIIYGAVFYAIIIFLLILIGEKFRDKALNQISSVTQTHNINIAFKPLLGVITFVFTLSVMQALWLHKINTNLSAHVQNMNRLNLTALSASKLPYQQLPDWLPSFEQASEQQQGYFIEQGYQIDYFSAEYSAQAALLSSFNAMYNAKRWTLIAQETIYVESIKDSVLMTRLVSPQNQYRTILYWYQFPERRFVSKVKAKLYRTKQLLLGQNEPRAVIAFSVKESEHQSSKAILLSFINKNNHLLTQINHGVTVDDSK